MVCVAPSSSGTRESRDVPGLRPNAAEVLLSLRSTGIAPPPPLPNFSWGPENLSLFYVLCTWPAIRRNLSLFYLLVVAFFKLASVFGDG